MPLDLSVVTPRSACPGCGTPIAAYDNIPVLSWVVLGGKCRACKAPISPRYAAVELLTGALFAWSWIDSTDSYSVAIKSCVFCFLITGLIFTDAETKLLPDLLTLPGIALGLLFSGLVIVDGPASAMFGRWLGHDPRILSAVNSFLGGAFGLSSILGIALLYEAARNAEGMGMGDVKLMCLIGTFLGVKLSLLVLVLGSLSGSLFGGGLMLLVWQRRFARRRARAKEPVEVSRTRAWNSAKIIFRNFEVPFGVFLGAAALVASFRGDAMIRWYLGLYR